MVKITNGINVFEVTRGAFDEIYSRQGYTILNDKGNTSDAPVKPEKNEDQNFLEEIVERPVSQWNKDEVKRFAALTNLDITGTKNANEAKEIIKEYLAENGLDN